MPKLITCIATFFSFIFSAYCQLPVPVWARGFNEIDYLSSGFATTVAIDNNGNVYSAGQFEYSLDFDPGPGNFTMQAAGPFDKAMFISKLDANGQFLWAKQIPNYMEFGRIEIKADKQGNVYLLPTLMLQRMWTLARGFLHSHQRVSEMPLWLSLVPLAIWYGQNNLVALVIPARKPI